MFLTGLLPATVQENTVKLTHDTYRFADGDFRFYAAALGPRRTIIFRVRTDRDPRQRALEKGIRGPLAAMKLLEPIALWLIAHRDLALLAINPDTEDPDDHPR
jgi:hypothetical protein